MSELDLGVLARERGWLHRLASTLVQDDEEARDLVQQTVLRALEAPAQGGVTTRAWLDRILRNLWIDNVRRRRAQALEDPASVGSAKPTVEEAAQRWEASSALREAVAQLPREQWEVVVLRFQEELTNAQIAERLGLSPRTISARLSEAYADLRRRLSGQFGRENWVLAMFPMAARMTRQKSRMASVSAAAALVGVAAVATMLGVGMFGATDIPAGMLEAARMPVVHGLAGGAEPGTDDELTVPLSFIGERHETAGQVVAPSSEPGTGLEAVPKEVVDLGPMRHVIIDGERVLGYEAWLLTDDSKLPDIETNVVREVGEEGFALALIPGFKITLRNFTDDDTRWITYPPEVEPDLEFATGSLEVHLGSDLNLPEGAAVDDDGNLERFMIYWTDGLGVTWVSDATIQGGVAIVDRVPEGQVEFKLFVSGVGLSASIGSWPSLGTARIIPGERTVVRL